MTMKVTITTARTTIIKTVTIPFSIKLIRKISVCDIKTDALMVHSIKITRIITEVKITIMKTIKIIIIPFSIKFILKISDCDMKAKALMAHSKAHRSDS